MKRQMITAVVCVLVVKVNERPVNYFYIQINTLIYVSSESALINTDSELLFLFFE